MTSRPPLIGVGDEFVAYSPEAAAKIVDVSERVPGRSEYDFSFELVRDTTEAGVYPIALVSYHIVCLQYDSQEKVDFVKSFMTLRRLGGRPGRRRRGRRFGSDLRRGLGAARRGHRPDPVAS